MLPLTTRQLASVALDVGAISLESDRSCVPPRRYVSPNGRNFTVRELLAAVEHYERLARVGPFAFPDPDHSGSFQN